MYRELDLIIRLLKSRENDAVLKKVKSDIEKLQRQLNTKVDFGKRLQKDLSGSVETVERLRRGINGLIRSFKNLGKLGTPGQLKKTSEAGLQEVYTPEQISSVLKKVGIVGGLEGQILDTLKKSY